MFKLKLFVAFPWVVTSTGPGGFMVACLFYDGNSRRLNRKWFYGEAYDSWLIRHRFIPYATAASHMTVLLGTYNICFGYEISKRIFNKAHLSGGLNYYIQLAEENNTTTNPPVVSRI